MSDTIVSERHQRLLNKLDQNKSEFIETEIRGIYCSGLIAACKNEEKPDDKRIERLEQVLDNNTKTGLEFQAKCNIIEQLIMQEIEQHDNAQKKDETTDAAHAE